MEEKTLTVEGIAAICHEANRQYCIEIGDLSQSSWEDAPDWQRNSAINGVMFHIENPDAGAEGSHENWMKVKLEDGWVYGEEKSAENKTHPCLVPYDQLPKQQRLKDSIFTSIVKALAN